MCKITFRLEVEGFVFYSELEDWTDCESDGNQDIEKWYWVINYEKLNKGEVLRDNLNKGECNALIRQCKKWSVSRSDMQ